MSICKGCGATIDWIKMKDGRYMPIEPEPEFIIEGDGTERFVTGEGEIITGRRALMSERNLLCEVAFIPHWKSCPEAQRFRRRR